MLPTLSLLKQIHQQIFSIPNQRKESKRRTHYCCYLLCQKAGLRVSEAVNFDLSAKTQQGLYQITKTKGKQERFAYIPKQVINELKKHDWKPNSTNRFNFYHFLRKIKREMNLPANTELTPHTLRRSFTTYHAEAGLPLPLLSKMLGHSSVRTTALYWMNTYHPDDDDNDSNIGAILAGKEWLENKKNDPDEPDSELPLINAIPPQPEPISQLIENLPNIGEANQILRQQLIEKDKETTILQNKLIKAEEQNADLQSDLNNLNDQNATLRQEKHQIQQNLVERDQTIKQLKQELTNEREQKTITQNNLTYEKQNNQSLQETNANLKQKLHTYEQNHANLTNAYQIVLKAKETTEKQLNQLTREVKNAVLLLSQWQKLNYYQQLEQQNQQQAQIIQPPPWKANIVKKLIMNITLYNLIKQKSQEKKSPS